MLHYKVASTTPRVHTDVFMKVYWYSINSVTTMVVTLANATHLAIPLKLLRTIIEKAILNNIKLL